MDYILWKGELVPSFAICLLLSKAHLQIAAILPEARNGNLRRQWTIRLQRIRGRHVDSSREFRDNWGLSPMSRTMCRWMTLVRDITAVKVETVFFPPKPAADIRMYKDRNLLAEIAAEQEQASEESGFSNRGPSYSLRPPAQTPGRTSRSQGFQTCMLSPMVTFVCFVFCLLMNRSCPRDAAISWSDI